MDTKEKLRFHSCDSLHKTRKSFSMLNVKNLIIEGSLNVKTNANGVCKEVIMLPFNRNV